ncbi:MAG TPA: hypothetical protein VE575_04790 [Acidimicrobiales bacterium]|jgi:hypothetical protein|nr:hypothetical protein [Acidimicrobiales bacterium]
MIVRSWNLRPRPGRYDDSIGLVTEGVKLADRHGAGDIRLTQAATAGPNTGLLVLTCEFDNLTAYGRYLDDTLADPEAQSYNHRIREAEAPFVYESTAVLVEIDLERSEPKRGRGRVLDARLGRARLGRWEETLAFAREAFDLADKHGAVGCRLFELSHAGPQAGVLCSVMEYESMQAFGEAGDRWLTDPDTRRITDIMRSDSPFEPVSSGLFTEVAIL